MAIRSTKKRKQRKYLYNAPLHRKKKFISGHLSEELRDKYGRRRFPLRKGDTVKVLRGELKGHVGKISEVHTKKLRVSIEKANITKADGKASPKLIHPSNLQIIKLDTSDPKRREKLSERTEGSE